MSLKKLLLRLPALSVVLAASVADASIVAAPAVTGGSPEYNANFALENAVDGHAADYASLGAGTDTFLEFTFPGPTTVDRIIVVNRDSNSGADLIGNFTLTFDGGVAVPILRTPVRGFSGIHSLGSAITATTIRLDVDTIGDGAAANTGVMEVIFLNTTAGLNLITGVSVIGSATPFNASYGAANAVDGIIGRQTGAVVQADYASASLGVDAYVDFDLGAIRPVAGFDWIDRIHNADRVTAFDLIFSQDDVFGNGDDIVQSYTNGGVALGAEFAPINARYVRYDVTAANGPNTGLNEILFYQAVPEPSVAGLIAAGLWCAAGRRRRTV